MSLTNYGETEVLTMFAENTTYYLALFTADPTDTGAMTNEVSGGSYARQEVTFGTPASGAVTNSAAIEFPTATAAWGTVTHWGLCDAATGGNVWWVGAITTPKSITAGDIYRVPVGNLQLSMD